MPPRGHSRDQTIHSVTSYKLDTTFISGSLPSTMDTSTVCGSENGSLDPCLLLRSQLETCELKFRSQVHILGPDHVDLVENLTTLGLCYQHMARDHPKALDCHHEALRILTKCRDSGKGDCKNICERIAATLTDLGFIYEIHAEFQCAHDKFAEAKRLLQSINTKNTSHKMIPCVSGCDRLAGISEEDSADCDGSTCKRVESRAAVPSAFHEAVPVRNTSCQDSLPTSYNTLGK
jgi:hypothetical protein